MKALDDCSRAYMTAKAEMQKNLPKFLLVAGPLVLIWSIGRATATGQWMEEAVAMGAVVLFTLNTIWWVTFAGAWMEERR